MGKTVVVHPGTQHSWQTSLAFQENEQLECLITSIYCSKALLDSVRGSLFIPSEIKNKILYEIGRRNAPYLNDELVVTIGIEEYIEVLCRRFGFFEVASYVDRFGNKRFLRKCQKILASSQVDVVWGYNMSFKELLDEKRSGVFYILDQTIGNWAVYNEVISEHYKEYKVFFRDSFRSISEELVQRNYFEIERSDKVVFGSDFSRSTFLNLGIKESKFEVIPYGFDEVIFKRRADKYHGGTVKFVFVGLLTPRKGIHLLLNVFSKLVRKYDIELTLVGGNQLPNEILEKYLGGKIKYLGSVSRSSIPDILNQHHCFVFPSLFEGGGIVLYEACAAGLAILQSKNCGDGVGNNNGVVMNELDEESLECAVIHMLSDADRLNAYMDNSYEWSRERRWKDYREKVRGLLNV